MIAWHDPPAEQALAVSSGAVVVVIWLHSGGAVKPAIQRSPDGTELGATGRFSESALPLELALMSWPDGLDWLVPRILDTIAVRPSGRAPGS